MQATNYKFYFSGKKDCRFLQLVFPWNKWANIWLGLGTFSQQLILGLTLNFFQHQVTGSDLGDFPQLLISGSSIGYFLDALSLHLALNPTIWLQLPTTNFTITSHLNIWRFSSNSIQLAHLITWLKKGPFLFL